MLRCGAQSHPAVVVGQIDTTKYEQRQTSGLPCHCYLAQSLLRIPDTGSCDIIRYLSCRDQITLGQQKKGVTRRSIPLDIESAREMSMSSTDPRGRPFWQCYRDLLWAAWAHHFPSEWIPCLLSQVGAIPVRNDEDLIRWKVLPSKSGVYSFQRDIMALVSAPWRARTCASTECGKPFVPNKNLRRYCSKECSIEAGHANQPEMVEYDRSITRHTHAS